MIYPPMIKQEENFEVSFRFSDLVVKKDNFTLLLTSSGQEWQFHIVTDI